MGLDIDPELEEKAQVLLDAGMELFKSGELRPAFEQ
jgi:hypothetical protein